jgi:hypothetical protein
LDLEYTYSIVDSALVIYTLSYLNSTYENGKWKYKKIDAIPNAYVDYLTYMYLFPKIKPTERLAHYEERIFRIYIKCKNSGIPFTDSIKAKSEIISEYYLKALDMIFTSKNYKYAAEISQRGTYLAPENSSFWVFIVLAKCLMGQYDDEIKGTVFKLKKMPSNVINLKDGFDELRSSIKDLEEKGQKCKGFEYIKVM